MFSTGDITNLSRHKNITIVQKAFAPMGLSNPTSRTVPMQRLREKEARNYNEPRGIGGVPMGDPLSI